MGFGSFVRNRHSGKCYAVSTIKHPILGVHETIVAEVVGKRLFGLLPKTSGHALLGIHTAESSHANEIQSLIVRFVESDPESEWNGRIANLAQRPEVLRVQDYPLEEDQVTSGREKQSLLWEHFHGKPNTQAVLAEKAAVVAALIEQIWDESVTLASSMQNRNPQIRTGERESREARAETAALFLRLVDELAFTHLGKANRDEFMRALEANVAMALSGKGLAPSAFATLIQERYEEYAIYRKWIPNEGESYKGTLLWEFTKKVASILGVGKSGYFNHLLAWLLLRALERWQLPELLEGRGFSGPG